MANQKHESMRLGWLLALGLFMGINAVNLHAAKPNIIFIVTGHDGYYDLEATDLRGEVDMPNINRLSTAGGLMTQAYCTAPQCVPSRAGIVTGHLSTGFGIDANGEGPLPNIVMLISDDQGGRGFDTPRLHQTFSRSSIGFT